ncbi:MAG TPA: ABC transporter permease, partial [Treponemataceae bacterium]|nr:ABC transporter permease [Treponemataceae bacterium]
MSSLPRYPEFAPLSLEMAREITPCLTRLPDGISEFSFAGFYLFRERYGYQVSLKDNLLIVL